MLKNTLSSTSKIFMGICTAIVCMLFIQCGEQAPKEPDAPAPETYNQPDIVVSKPQKESHIAITNITFTDITSSAGITFQHNSGRTGNKYLPETMGAGCALFDYDKDGDLDIFFVNGRDIISSPDSSNPPSTCELYINDGYGSFTEITKQAGLDISLYGMGCSIADYDGDDDMDIFLTSAMDGQRLLKNNDGIYSDMTQSAGLTSPAWKDDKGNSFPYWSTSPVFFDYNNDGWLDLFVCNYVQWSIENDVFTTLTGIGKAFTRPDLYKGLSPLLYKNNGDGTFDDVTHESGIWNPDAKSLGVSVEDLNQDGWMDIVVANDAHPDFLYENSGNGTFTDVGMASGIAYGDDGRARAGMGIDIAYPLAESKPVIAVGNFSHEPVSMFVQEAEGFYIESSGRTRISRPSLLSLTFGLMHFDYDYDGWLDLIIANGHIEPDIQVIEKEVSYKQSPQLFRNMDGKTFEDINDQLSQDFTNPFAGRGLAYGDIDGDGDVDVLFTACGGAPKLLRNDGGAEAHQWVRLKLQGQSPNTSAIGSKVSLTINGKTQIRRVKTGSSYCSQSELTLSFGLGAQDSIEALSIDWYDGTKKEFSSSELNGINIKQTNTINKS